MRGPADGAPPMAVQRYRALVRIRNELRFLAMNVSDHPMRVLREEAERHGCIDTQQAARRPGRHVRVAAVVAATRRVRMRTGAVLQFVTLEDERGLLEAVVAPPAYAALGERITTAGPYLVAGRIEESHGDVHLALSEVHPFFRRSRAYGEP